MTVGGSAENLAKLSAGARRLSEVGALAGKPVATLVPQARTMELIRTEAILHLVAKLATRDSEES